MIDRTGNAVYYNNFDNLSMVNFTILCIFPILLFFVLFFKSKILKKGEFDESCWDVNDAKALQVFAAFGVLIHHLTGACTRYGDAYKGPVTVMSYVGILFTTIFFFFSGFGLIRSYQTKENYLDGFLWKKFMAVGLPFMFTNLLYILIGLGENRIYSPFTFFTSAFGFTLINTNAWYIVELIILYIVFYFSFKYVKKEKDAMLIVSIAAIVMIFIGFMLKHDYTQVNGHWFRGEWWFNTTLLFVVGMYAAKYRDEIYKKFKDNYKLTVILTLIVLAISAVLEAYSRINFTYYAETYTYSGFTEKAAMYVTQTMLCVSFMTLVLLICMKMQFGNKIIKFLVPITLEIFLIQDMCMLNYNYDSVAPDYVIFTSSIIMTLVAAILLNKVIKLLRRYVEDFKNKSYKLPDISSEKRTIYKKEKSVVQTFILVYAVLFVGLIVCSISELSKSMSKDKILKAELEQIKTAKEFDTVIFSTFECDVRTEGEEDFEWYLIKKEDDKALLLSKYALYNQSYNQKHEAVSYEDSLIRDIIINEGYYDVFDETSRKYITVGENTEDPVFLLSKEEIETYAIPDEVLRCPITFNCKEYSGLYRDENNDDNTWWWLRSNEPVVEATIVNSTGIVEINKEEVNRPHGGLRPAIWVKLD